MRTFFCFSQLNYAYDVNNKELGDLGSHIIWVNVTNPTPKIETQKNERVMSRSLP